MTLDNVLDNKMSVVITAGILLVLGLLMIANHRGRDKPLLADQRSLFQGFISLTYHITHGGQERKILQSNSNRCVKLCKLGCLNVPTQHFCCGMLCRRPGANFSPRVLLLALFLSLSYALCNVEFNTCSVIRVRVICMCAVDVETCCGVLFRGINLLWILWVVLRAVSGLGMSFISSCVCHV